MQPQNHMRTHMHTKTTTIVNQFWLSRPADRTESWNVVACCLHILAVQTLVIQKDCELFISCEHCELLNFILDISPPNKVRYNTGILHVHVPVYRM